MSKLCVNSIVDVPNELYPFDDSVDIFYLVCYRLGNSVRVVYRCRDYHYAGKLYNGLLHKDKFILRQVINLQLMV